MVYSIPIECMSKEKLVPRKQENVKALMTVEVKILQISTLSKHIRPSCHSRKSGGPRFKPVLPKSWRRTLVLFLPIHKMKEVVWLII